MKKYIAAVEFKVTGKVEIHANSKEEAQEIAEKHFGLTVSNFHTSTDQVENWDFPVHPEKKVKNIKFINHV